MLEYFNTFYIEQMFGPSYAMTNVAFVVGVIVLLRDVKWKSVKSVLGLVLECIIGMAVEIVLSTIYYEVFGMRNLDRMVMLLFLALYVVFRSKYRWAAKVVLAAVYFACFTQSITLSEPIGEWIVYNINEEYTWGLQLTWITVAILNIIVIAYLRKYNPKKIAFLPLFAVAVVVIASILGVLLQWYNAGSSDELRLYRVFVAGSFWILELFSYNMFYRIGKEYDANMELNAIQNRLEFDNEMMNFSRMNYEEMHQVRHELRNHVTYLRTLSEAGETEKLRNYINQMAGETDELFSFIECGNDIVNAVMNHALKECKAAGIRLESTLVVPPELPYQETDLCSLLSNLVENAIEAAKATEVEDKVITVSIRPLQDYLFIHITNPVNHEISDRKRLRLHTTKEDKTRHGYGTKVIKRIVSKYLGSVKYSIDGDTFTSDVMVSLKDEETEAEE